MRATPTHGARRRSAGPLRLRGQDDSIRFLAARALDFDDYGAARDPVLGVGQALAARLALHLPFGGDAHGATVTSIGYSRRNPLMRTANASRAGPATSGSRVTS